MNTEPNPPDANRPRTTAEKLAALWAYAKELGLMDADMVQQESRDMLSVKEVAELLKTAPRTVRRIIHRDTPEYRRLRTVKVGRCIRVKREWLREYVERNR